MWHLCCPLTGAVAGVFGRLTDWSTCFLASIFRARQKAYARGAIASVFCLLSSVTWCATAPNTLISNTAIATYQIGASGVPSTISATATFNTAACGSPVQIDLLQYVPAARSALAPYATSQNVQPGFYFNGTSNLPLANPTLLGDASPTPLPANLLLTPLNDMLGNPVSAYSRNEPIFIRVTSSDDNLNPAAPDSVTVTLTSATGGDSETLVLMETGIATGVFAGAIPSVFIAIGSPSVPNDGSINISAHNEIITSVYSRSDCGVGTIASSSSGLVDPYGIVFDSSSGTAVNGATVTLINTLTSLPATAFCDDGVTALPQPLTSGAATICDATMVAGGYRFPQVPAGSYKIVVAPPAGYTAPSTVLAASLPATVGAPATASVILGNPGVTPGGSYGGVLTLWGPALKVDIPADAGSTTLTIQKSAGKTVVGIGEFVPYTLTLTNNSALALSGVQVADHIPPGFRYQAGSARLDGVAIANPLISADARTLTFSIDIAASSTATLRYVLEVTPGAHSGTAENTAAATGVVTSNTARASVLVREELNRSKAILIGRVIDGSCDDKVENDDKGLANARIVLQDGSYILTDSEGRWHLDNVRPGTHVVQLDLDSLPKNYEVVACEQNSRFAGRKYSQFVNVRGGSLWRADFHVQKKAPETVRLTQTLSSAADSDLTRLSLSLNSSTEVTGYSATVMLPEFASYIPGSAQLNGATIADPDIVERALIFRSQARPASWQDEYTFAVENVAPNATIKSLVRFTPPGRAAQNTPPAQITLVSAGPASVTTSTEVAVEVADLRPAKSTQDNDTTHLLETLPYDEVWLAQEQPGKEWLHPQENFHPNLPVILVAVKHEPTQKLNLSVNGEGIDPIKFDGTKMNSARTVALSTWRGVAINEGNNKLELVIRDASGNELSRTTRNIYYAATPDRVELVPAQSRLIADGKTKPMIAVRILDKNGVPVRRGISGEFMLNEPYRSADRHEGIEREPLSGRIGGTARYEVQGDGRAIIELEPTTQTGEAVLNFPFGNKRNPELRAWLEPGQRDWILVGFAEGTLGHKTLSGNIEALKAASADDQLFDENKLAFYAKGSIKGEYLLTLAYDTSKQTRSGQTSNGQLKQAIDPTQYYTLYADATQANFDAASASRLYVKLERKQFYAMFGDFDTGLTVTELSRYSRSLNGVKSEYKGDKMSYNAFATVSAQAYVKDEIPGNGTSGEYKLSRTNLIINSDKIRVETRDRFQSQIIINTQSLTRYLDYDIDYNKGALVFREPIAVRDGSFNPIYIIAEYESTDPTDEKASFGGRGSIKASKDLEIGATVIHEGTVGASGNLQGADATYQVDDKTKVRAEIASSDRNLAGVDSGGNAWLGEIQHREDKWDSKAYIREQEGAFGVGQQAASEIATRKMGVDGRVKLSDTTQVQGHAYQQDNLTTDAKNSVVEGRVEQRLSNDLSTHYGARTARDENATGSAHSNQLLGGAAYTLLDKKLALRADAEISGGTSGTATMPDRYILGSDYKVSEHSKIFAEQEFARGEKISANTTRAGLRTQPWSGNEMSASVGQNTTNDAERLYTNMGMVQRWQINERWQTNFSLDRSKTLHNSAAAINLNTPLPSGTSTGDYTATSISAAYTEKMWSSNGRIEIRNASMEHQKNLQLGLQRQLDQGRTAAVSYALREVDGAANDTRYANLRLSYAHRPNDSRWVWFDRLDYITQSSQSAGGSLKGSKLVNNINANYMPNRRTQIALHYGSKYVLDTIDGTDYTGYTDLIGTEIRRDLTPRWDIGVFASMMRSLNSGVREYGVGASVGYKVVDNMWLSAGYNVRGLSDRDFSGAGYRAQGPYVTLRMKVDQDTFGLNKGGEILRPLTPE